VVWIFQELLKRLRKEIQMNLKNSALQDLYDTLVIAGPVYKAFEECDEKLSESIAFTTIKDLQDRNDILERSNKALLSGSLNLSTEKNILKNRISRLEKEIEELKKQNENIASQYQKLTIENKRLQDTKTTLEKASDDRTNLREACDKLSGENRRLNALIEWLREEVNWYRKHYKEQSDKINELTKNYQDLSIKLKRHQINVGRESRYLWDMLQEVSDYYYFGGDDEFNTDDCEMTSMTDIIDNLNVNQFLEAYKNWHKAQKQTWECTLEGNIKINGDLLGKVCGIKIDDD
jgi:chromosome segregation ATPase